MLYVYLFSAYNGFDMFIYFCAFDFTCTQYVTCTDYALSIATFMYFILILPVSAGLI
jgi:hypothetical protein